MFPRTVSFTNENLGNIPILGVRVTARRSQGAEVPCRVNGFWVGMAAKMPIIMDFQLKTDFGRFFFFFFGTDFFLDANI